MSLILKILSCLYLCAAVQCVHQVSWLPCQFIDEHVFVNNEGHTETQLIHREAMLQFGKKGDTPVNPHALTFLITGSKLDLQRYMDGVEAEQLECELRRYSTQGIHVRWPVLGAQEYNHWFSCTLRHAKGLFTVTGFLRRPSDQSPPGQQDYRKWPAIGDREILTTTEPPRVSLNTGPTLSLQEGKEQKVACEAESYYPLDVEIVWHVQDPAVSGQRVGAPLPKVLQNVLLSSHKHNLDKTYSLTAFFYLQASLRDSGRQFTCSVSHQSLRVPIKKSFILIVEEPISWMFYLTVGTIMVTLVFVLYVLLRYLHSGNKKFAQKKPY